MKSLSTNPTAYFFVVLVIYYLIYQFAPDQIPTFFAFAVAAILCNLQAVYNYIDVVEQRRLNNELSDDLDDVEDAL